MDDISKSEAMASMDAIISNKTSIKMEYESLGHNSYFDKYNRLEGLTKEQFEVCKRKWGKETWERLYERESDKFDNF